MANVAVIGTVGDEGKGKIVDWLSEREYSCSFKADTMQVIRS